MTLSVALALVGEEVGTHGLVMEGEEEGEVVGMEVVGMEAVGMEVAAGNLSDRNYGS